MSASEERTWSRTPTHYWTGMLVGALLAASAGWAYEYWKMEHDYARMEGRLAGAFGAHRAERLVDTAISGATAQGPSGSWTWSEERLEKLDALGFSRAEDLGSPYRDYSDRAYLVALVLSLPGGLLGLLLVAASNGGIRPSR